MVLAEFGSGKIRVVELDPNVKSKSEQNLVREIFAISGLQAPAGVACDRKGQLLVACEWNGHAKLFDVQGRLIRTFACQGNQAVSNPYDVWVLDTYGVIGIADHGNHRLRIWTRDGSQELANVMVPFATALHSDFDDYLLVAEQNPSGIEVFDPRNWKSAGKIAENLFSSAFGMCVEENDQVFVSNWGKSQIQVIQGIRRAPK